MLNKNKLLSLLPAVRGKSILVRSSQTVGDIVREVLDAHIVFASDYDRIAGEFDGYSDSATYKKIFRFIKDNIPYKEEKESKQATKSPGVILTTPTSDCKCYALFVAGVLDALNRRGRNFEWSFAFAGYDNSRDVTHVFVTVGDVWIDPVLDKLDTRDPMPKVLKLKKPAMALRRLSGTTAVGDYATKQESFQEQLERIAPCEAVLTVIDTRPVDLVWPSPAQLLDSATLIDAPIAQEKYSQDVPDSTVPGTSYMRTDTPDPVISPDDNQVRKNTGLVWGLVGLGALLFLAIRKK